MIDRRALIAASLAAASAGPALAQRSNRAITEGPLTRNALARHFERLDEEVAWPPSDLLGPGGRVPVSHYRGKTILLSLWNETCAPCLVEMPVFARLNARFANDRFEIVPVITGSRRLNTLARAQKFLNDRKIAIPTLIDGGRAGDELLKTVTTSRSEPSGALPCTLLIDRDGKLRGRQIGFVLTLPADAAGKSGAELAASARSIWEGADAEAFIEGLRAGVLG